MEFYANRPSQTPEVRPTMNSVATPELLIVDIRLTCAASFLESRRISFRLCPLKYLDEHAALDGAAHDSRAFQASLRPYWL